MVKFIFYQSLLPFFIVFKSFGQYIDDNQYQESILKCATDSLKIKGIDLPNFYNKYETSLVQSSQLEDRSGDSYMKTFYNALTDEKLKKYDVVIINDIDLDSIFPSVLEGIGNCLASMKDDITLRKSESKLDKFFDEIEKLADDSAEETNFTVVNMVKFVTKFFKSNDFEKPLYRIYALNIFYGCGIPRDLYNELD